MRDVLVQALAFHFPDMAQEESPHPPKNSSVFLTDEKTAPASGIDSALVIHVGDFPVRLGDILSRIAHHVSRAAMKSFTIGPWIFFPSESKISPENGGDAVRLTEKECGILLLLHEKNGAVASRQELLDRIWRFAEGVETHTLETHVYRLRQKIEDDPAKPQRLLTEGDGYRLAL